MCSIDDDDEPEHPGDPGRGRFSRCDAEEGVTGFVPCRRRPPLAGVPASKTHGRDQPMYQGLRGIAHQRAGGDPVRIRFALADIDVMLTEDTPGGRSFCGAAALRSGAAPVDG